MSNQTIMSFQRKMPYRVACQLPDCHKPVNNVYQVNIDDHSINFCSNDHARVGIARWQEKKQKGIRPGVPPTTTLDTEEMVGDNIADLEVNE